MSIDSSDAVAAATRTREQRLLRLNEQYVHASLSGDVEWCRAHLADDFVCIDSDGSVQFRTGFLRAAALGSDLSEYKLDYVDVRFYGEVALVRASGSWVSKSALRASAVTPTSTCTMGRHGKWSPRRSRAPRRRLETRRASKHRRHSSAVAKEGENRPVLNLSCPFASSEMSNVHPHGSAGPGRRDRSSRLPLHVLMHAGLATLPGIDADDTRCVRHERSG